MLHTSRRHELTHARVCVRVCVLVCLSPWQLESSRTRRTRTRARDLCTDATNYGLGATVTATVSPSSYLCVCMCVACHVCACVSSSSSSTSKPIFGFQRSSKTVSNEIYAMRLKDGSENEHTHKHSVCVSHTWQLCVCPFPIFTCRVIFGSSLPASASRVAYFMAFPSLIRRQRQYFISNCWQSFLIKYDRLPDRLLLWGQLIELAKTPLLQLK